MTTPGETAPPRLIAWELTRACPLACRHCRASATTQADPAELTTAECFRLLENIASFARPIMILTGGEPMLRGDICDIAAEATRLGLRAVLATCGVTFDRAAARAVAESGIRRISVSLDGARAESHDAFRGVAGAFASALAGIEAARGAGLEFQINTTVTRRNVAELPAIRDLAAKLGAITFNPFLLVPAGRARRLTDQELSPQQYEQTLRWLAKQQAGGGIAIRVTCAPHYQRILRQRGAQPAGHDQTKGCMAGQSFAFVSHRGVVQPCGFLELPCGDLRACGLDFRSIWRTAEPLRRLRDIDAYHGRCGYCEFRRVCGGCRARAYARTGDYLAEEPFCAASTLVAADVPEDRLDEVAEIVNRRPEVTHNYRRDHRLNLWFTLTASSEGRLDEIFGDLRRLTGIGLYSLPAEKTYKIRTFFPLDDRVDRPATAGPSQPARAVSLNGWRKELARALEGDLAVSAEPFGELANRLDSPVGEVIAQVRRWLETGLIRRVGALVDHRRLGYVANAMAVFAAGPRQADAVGEALARRPEVSHCYLRRALEAFPYNLFAMFHGRDAGAVHRSIDALAAEWPIDRHEVLFSTAEYKKSSARYFS